eukprot:jgi/Antlo1/968/2122
MSMPICRRVSWLVLHLCQVPIFCWLDDIGAGITYKTVKIFCKEGVSSDFEASQKECTHKLAQKNLH